MTNNEDTLKYIDNRIGMLREMIIRRANDSEYNYIRRMVEGGIIELTGLRNHMETQNEETKVPAHIPRVVTLSGMKLYLSFTAGYILGMGIALLIGLYLTT